MTEPRILYCGALPLAGRPVDISITEPSLKAIIPIIERIGRRLLSRRKSALIVADLERIVALVCGDSLIEIQRAAVTPEELHGVLDAVRAAALASENPRHALAAQALQLAPINAELSSEN